MSDQENLDLIKTTHEIEFKIDDNCVKTFELKQLSVKELELFDRKVQANAKKLWLARIQEVAELLKDKEKTKYLVEASKESPDLTTDRQKWMSSPDGISAAILPACPELKPYWESIIDWTENAKAVSKAWDIAMGILNSKKDPDNIASEEKSAEKNL